MPIDYGDHTPVNNSNTRVLKKEELVQWQAKVPTVVAGDTVEQAIEKWVLWKQSPKASGSES